LTRRISTIGLDNAEENDRLEQGKTSRKKSALKLKPVWRPKKLQGLTNTPPVDAPAKVRPLTVTYSGVDGKAKFHEDIPQLRSSPQI
jgi:hypothetical protein